MLKQLDLLKTKTAEDWEKKNVAIPSNMAVVLQLCHRIPQHFFLNSLKQLSNNLYENE